MQNYSCFLFLLIRECRQGPDVISAGALLTRSAHSFIRLHVVPLYIKYFYFPDDPVRDDFAVGANHPSGHQVKGSP